MTKTVEEWLNEWLELYVEPCKKENTYLCYKYVVKMILDLRPQSNTELISEFNEMELQKWINTLSKKYAKSTIKTAIGILERSYKAAVRNHLCLENPATCLTLPDASEKIIRALTKTSKRQLKQQPF